MECPHVKKDSPALIAALEALEREEARRNGDSNLPNRCRESNVTTPKGLKMDRSPLFYSLDDSEAAAEASLDKHSVDLSEQYPEDVIEFQYEARTTSYTGELTQKEEDSESQETDQTSQLRRIWTTWCRFYSENEFVLLVAAAILLAEAYPALGAKYLQPQVSADWVAVILIFCKSSQA